ncbi:MAG: DUF2953 domain-containing protein [Bacillota bacterium]|nr:DUF2953 domain-containing protein [Bacillota bacterium]
MKGSVPLIYLIVSSVILLILVYILYGPSKLEIKYRENKLNIIIHFGFLKLNINPDTGKKSLSTKEKSKTEGQDENKEEKAFNKLISSIRAFGEASDGMKKHITFEKLIINVSYSSGDVAVTGIATGLAYASIYNLIGILGNIFELNSPEIEIKPIFQDKPEFSLYIDGIIKTKLVHIIFIALRFTKVYNKENKKSKESKRKG